MRFLLLTASLLVGAIGGCGGDGVSQSSIPQVELKEGQRIVTKDSTLNVRADDPAIVAVSNVGSGELLIKEITIVSDPVGAFTVTSMPMPTAVAPISVGPRALAHQFQISYDPTVVASGGRRATATVTVHMNQTLNAGETLRFNVAPEISLGRLVVNPAVLDFGVVSALAPTRKTANLLNTGSSDLAVTRVIFGGHAGFTATIGGVDYVADAESASNGIVFSPPLIVPAGSAQKVDVMYLATGSEAAKGKLLFFAAGDVDGVLLEVVANLSGPCIRTTPSYVAFGGKLVGSLATTTLDIESCGDGDLVIRDVEMAEDANGLFAVNEAALGAYPITIGPGEKVSLPVTFLPVATALLGADGAFVVERGQIRITSNAFQAALDVAVEGFGTDGRCPVADIQIAEGLEVLPQTQLHLSATGSFTANTAITGYEWSVVQPSGSVSTFLPSAYAETTTFDTNIVGEYIFRLNVTDSAGNRSCATAQKTVTVMTDDAIHVELLWRTPGDINESDTGGDQVYFSMGSDVDLHMLSPKAAGQYFHGVYDCFWRNKVPEWGVLGPSDNPRLDLDDTDGGGPENLNVDVPEQGVRYQVGVHYWDDWGYGKAYATLRIYIYGVLRDQWDNVELINTDMWDAHYIDWPSGQVTRIGVEPQITSNIRP